MRKKVGIITFHASHNYGSMLQAYALQQVILGMGFDCEIINFRTERQICYYQPGFRRGTVQGKIKRCLFLLPYFKLLLKKYHLFEDFLQNDLQLTDKTYTTLEELAAESFPYDYYISGSDQIWNTCCFDFDWAFYLAFVRSGEKIAYAPSMGPFAEKAILPIYYDRIKQLLRSYTSISVREEGTARWIREHFGFDVSINLDPTLLLSVKQWNNIIDSKPLVEGDYVFVYTPFFNRDVLILANRLSNYYKMKVVLSQVFDTDLLEHYKFVLLNNNRAVVKCDVGPKEFLNLCKYARLVCGGSFHAVAFSILLHTPFLAVDGMSDNRISNLLNITNFQSRSVSSNMSFEMIPDLFDMDFSDADLIISYYRQESLCWLKNELH